MENKKRSLNAEIAPAKLKALEDAYETAVSYAAEKGFDKPVKKVFIGDIVVIGLKRFSPESYFNSPRS